MKILFNNCYGGFSISEKAAKLYYERKGTEPVLDCFGEIDTDCFNRDDELLIQIVEELGSEANGRCAEIGIAEIPDNSYWSIDEYDGSESVEYTLTPPPKVFGAEVLNVFERKED